MSIHQCGVLEKKAYLMLLLLHEKKEGNIVALHYDIPVLVWCGNVRVLEIINFLKRNPEAETGGLLHQKWHNALQSNLTYFSCNEYQNSHPLLPYVAKTVMRDY